MQPRPGAARPGAWSAPAPDAGAPKKVWAPARPSAAAGAPRPGALAARVPPRAVAGALTVSTQSSKGDIGIQTLLGDFKETGTNHGKKVYQKMQKIAGHEEIKVFLYYWDQRDGSDFSGWWFGDQVGGSQVWARSASHGAAPPRTGWKVPWDAPRAEPGLLCVNAAGFGAAPAPTYAPSAANGFGGGPPPAPPVSPAGALASKLRKATGQVEALEGAVLSVVAAAKALGPNPGSSAVQDMQQQLQKQQLALSQAQQDLTIEISETRRGGPSATSTVTELSKLSPRLRKIQQQLAEESQKVRVLLSKAQATVANAQTAAATKAQEERETKQLEEMLPATQEVVALSIDAVEAVSSLAAPLIAEPPDESGDLLKQAMEEIETSVAEAQEKITEARRDINAKLQAARKYAPEARKAALQEFSSLQQKLTEAQKRLGPYKTFKREFRNRVEARKQLSEVAEGLAEVELEVEKASMMVAASEHGQLSEEELASIEKLLAPAKASIDKAQSKVESRMPGADGAMMEELAQLLDKVKGIRTTLEAVSLTLRRQRESFSVQGTLTKAAEKVEAAAQALVKCQEAEMPFLKGVEILPAEESSKAIQDSEAAVLKTENAINSARNYLRAKLNEAKKYVKELSASVTEELTSHQTRLETSAKKLETFKKETAERKTSALLAEVVEAVTDMEKRVDALKSVAVVLSSEDLESVSVDTLKDAIEKTGVAEKEAASSMQHVRKVYALKQREAKGQDATAALSKLSGRISAAQTELAKARKAAGSGERLIKGKAVLAEEEARVAEAEVAVRAAEKRVKPGAEEAALGIEAGSATDAEVEEMSTALASSQKALKASARVLETTVIGVPPSTKPALQKLLDRSKAGLKSITELLALTKKQRERVMSEAFVRSGKERTEAVEAAIEKVAEAEMPFLKGLEVLPAGETMSAMEACEEAIASVKTAVAEARNFIAAKNLEIKQFAEAASKPAATEFGQLTERINCSSSRLAQFKKDTESRKKIAMIQEAGEKVTALETEVKLLGELAEPFAKDGEKDESEEATDKLVAQLKAAQGAMDTTKRFLSARQRGARGNEAHTDTLAGLEKRVREAQGNLAKHKRIASAYEAKYIAKNVVAEAEAKLAEIDEEVKKATEAAAPLIGEEAGERFLVGQSLRTLAQALRERMREKSLTHEALFAEAAGGSAPVSGLALEAFAAWVARQPEALGKEELAFNETRREAMARQLDADGDGNISLDEFKAMFLQRFKCFKEISVTDAFEVTKSKTLAKLQGGEMLETYHGPQTDESSGMMRIECTVLPAGATGFVTMQGNQGTKFISQVLPLTGFCQEVEQTLEACANTVQKLFSFFGSKLSELSGQGRDAALLHAKSEVSKLKGRAAGAQSSLQKLQQKFEEARREFPKRERKERDAHIYAKEQREADALLAPAKAKGEAMEAALAAVEAETKPMLALKTAEELTAFATPLAASEAAERAAEAAIAAVESTKEVVAAQQKLLPAVAKGAMLDAKRDFVKMSGRAEVVRRKVKAALEGVREKCSDIVAALEPLVSDAMRAEMRKQGMASHEQYFLALCPPNDDSISEAAFCKCAASLLGEVGKPEQLGLLFRSIEAGGICKRKFQAFLQRYYSVVKSIALTNGFSISSGKTLRKLDAEELVELVEGPRSDDKLGVTRIFGRSLIDGLEGWVSLKGNQGTPFLKEIEKRFYTTVAEQPLQEAFQADGEAKLVRSLRTDEVLELVEGPRKVTFEAGLRVKGRASSDGAVGWFTAKDKNGAIFAEADSNYYSCTASVAVTDSKDIKDCKVIRKLSVGELFIVEEDPVDEPGTGITRVKGTCLQDEVTGWITLKGNAGTVFAEPSTKHFCILQETPLTQQFPTARPGDEVRKLAKGEAMQVLEGPKQENHAPEVRAKVKTLTDGAVGWVSLRKGSTRRWSPIYKCKAESPMHKSLEIDGAEVIRQIVVGEQLEFLEGPTGSANVVRIKAKAAKDCAVGWVTIRDVEGRVAFEC